MLRTLGKRHVKLPSRQTSQCDRLAMRMSNVSSGNAHSTSNPRQSSTHTSVNAISRSLLRRTFVANNRRSVASSEVAPRSWRRPSNRVHVAKLFQLDSGLRDDVARLFPKIDSEMMTTSPYRHRRRSDAHLCSAISSDASDANAASHTTIYDC